MNYLYAQKIANYVSKDVARLRLDDDLWFARCEARCYDRQNHYDNCVKLCLNLDLPKFGTCPASRESLLDTPCVKSCTLDSQCFGISMCCTHHCGSICRQPIGLSQIQFLPNIPTNITVHKKGSKNITIWWNTDATHQKIIYVLQERHHIGSKFIKNRLGEWQTRKRTKRTLLTFTRDSIMKPGRWYQFRVAAFNENGTKGFSSPTSPFKTRLPRPPRAPQDLRTGPLRLQNTAGGMLELTFSWRPPRVADLPIDKYKVYWSRRLPGVQAHLDSVLVSSLIVPQDQTSVQLINLHPDSQYFLQVQAMSQFDKLKIKGEKASKTLNTTFDSTIKIIPEGKKRLILKTKYYHKNGKVYATINWNKRNDDQQTKYFVKVYKQKCSRKSETHFVLHSTARTSIELFGLNSNCQYLAQVIDSLDNSTGKVILEPQAGRKRRRFKWK
ncbi:anosmin-1 [Ctenocephalides felis]|uniref:anosmin-1 n=1 Tax=Ctenocephalides felis TaxID=7515 RepID=UPI000E6E5172|nr:anosmin-1 [Ctenocephalides felis]